MKKTTVIILVSLIVIAAMLLLTFRRGRQVPEFEVATVERGNIIISTFASGEIRAKNRRELKFGGSGDVMVVAVVEGDSVAEGQFLAALDQRSLKEALTQAEANLKRARADLDYAGETRRLFLDEHRYDSPSEELFAQFGQQDARVRAAVAAVEAANSQVESTRISLNNSILNSPIAGIAVEINIKEGESFNPARPAIIVADLSEVIFEAEVDESEISGIEIGQKTRVRLDAYSNTEFEGQILEIAKATTLDSSGNKVIKVEIELIGEDKKELYLGLSGDAEIIFKEKQNVLLVLVEAVFSEDGKDYIFVIEDEKSVKRQVELGLENDDMVEVVSGVREGEKFVLSDKRSPVR